MAFELFAAALGCYAAGAVVAPVAGRSSWVAPLPAAAGAVGGALLAVAAGLWLAGAREALPLPPSTPLGGFELRSAPLPGLFLLLTGLVGCAISVYSSAYTAHTGGPARQAGVHALLNLSLGSMALLLAAGNALTLLLAWEAMSIFTYALVTVEFDHPDRPRAAFLMLALSELGFVAMAVAFALVGGFQPWNDFAALAVHRPAAGAAGAAFLLFLFGFGAKAGLVPLQGWLPEAHPAAPSNVSALLSAVVVKMAIYGLILSTVTLLGPPPAWWGFLALGLGVVTAAYGILFSLLAHDLKRALAYSTVENLGFMISMLGAALLFASAGKALLAAMALLVTALHALYHSLLKGTLFMGAGSVDVATGTRDMDRLGGLARTMRWTTALFLIASMGLAGIPPMNGFQTEWLGLQVLIRAHDLASAGDRVSMAAAGTLLTLTFALAVTTYIRIVGGTFLGAPRGEGARDAREAPPAMLAGMLLPAAAAVASALVPPLGIGAAVAAVEDATHGSGLMDAVLAPIFTHPERYAGPVQLGATFLDRVIPANSLVIVPTSFDYAFISPTYVFLTLVAVIGLVALGLRIAGVPARRRSQVWIGGVPDYLPGMQYTASAFTNPLRFIFGGIYGSEREIEGDYHQAPFFARRVHYVHRFVEPVETYGYRPVVRGARWLSRSAAPLQAGNLGLYLLYLFGVFLVALFVR